MDANRYVRTIANVGVAGLGIASAAYAAYVGITWARYGRGVRAFVDDRDLLLDRFLPQPEVACAHTIRVAAPAEVTFATAEELDLESLLVRGIFKTRELVVGRPDEEPVLPRGLFAKVKALGWGVLAEVPGREIIFGAATQPWESQPVFRTLTAEEFISFSEPGYVKIAWTLGADPVGAHESIARTETRVTTTDRAARAKFRRYWSFFSPGIFLIRKILLRALKTGAEGRAGQKNFAREALLKELSA